MSDSTQIQHQDQTHHQITQSKEFRRVRLFPLLQEYPYPKIRPILEKVNRILYPPLDTESIAMDIWTKCWTKRIPPTSTLIRNHCIDELRRLRIEKDYEKILVKQRDTARDTVSVDLSSDVSASLDSASLLKLISERARVSVEDMILIYLRFYENLTLSEISERLECSSSKVFLHLDQVLKRLQDARRALGL
jgi:RNA polymerase sigma factor (sigma-70 family)